MGQERQPPAQEDTSQSTDPAGPPPLLPHSPTQGTWSHQLLPGSWLRALGRRRQVKVAPPQLSHSPPLPHCPLPSLPIPFWGRHCAQRPPTKERRAGTQESWERRPGLGVLTSARLWAKQAQHWFVEGHCPAQLIAYPQRGLGHFCHDHWEERRPGSPSGL